MVLIGQDLYAYYGRSPTFKAGNPATEKHQAFNPILTLDLPSITYNQKLEKTAGKMVGNIIYDQQLVPGIVSYTTHFRDPITLAMLFPYKGVTTAWSGTGDQLTFNFSSMADIDKNIWMQLFVWDKSGGGNDAELLYDGGQMVSYGLNIKHGEPIIESFDIEYVELAVNSQACDIDDEFDDGAFVRTGIDGGWSNWDGAYTAANGEVAMSKDAIITLGAAAVAGIDIEECNLQIGAPKTNWFVQSSLTAAGNYLNGFEFSATLTGKSKDNTAFSEFLAAIGTKAKATFKIQYGTTKYFEFTNAYYQKADPLTQLPKGVEAVNTTYHIMPSANSVFTYSWNANEATDPSLHIEHTNL